MQPLDAARSNPREGGASFPLRHRCLRAVWQLVWTLFGIWTPVPLHGWRRLLVRMFGAQLASTARIYPGVRIWYPPNLTMADFACMGPEVECYSMDRIFLGPYALVSQRAHLCAGTHDLDDPNFQVQTRPIELGAHCWVAAEAFVGPGVVMSEGAVLGARAVTVKNLDAWTVYAGNPARKLRSRRHVCGLINSVIDRK